MPVVKHLSAARMIGVALEVKGRMLAVQVLEHLAHLKVLQVVQLIVAQARALRERGTVLVAVVSVCQWVLGQVSVAQTEQ